MDPTGCRWMFIEVDVWICPEENIGNQGRGAKLGGWAACREDRVLHPHYWLVHVATPGVQPLPVALAITGWLSHSCDHPQLSFSHFSWHYWSLGSTSGTGTQSQELCPLGPPPPSYCYCLPWRTKALLWKGFLGVHEGSGDWNCGEAATGVSGAPLPSRESLSRGAHRLH